MLRRIVIVGSVLFISLVVIVVLLISRHWHSITIGDPTKPTTLVLEAGRFDGWPMDFTSGIAVQVKGDIEGEAEVAMRDSSGQDIRKERIKGHVDSRLGGDWFQRRCELQFRPLNVKSGNLIVYYVFE